MPKPTEPPRLEDLPKPGDEELAAAAGGAPVTGERIEPPGVTAAEREAAERQTSRQFEQVQLINMQMGNLAIFVPQGTGVVRVRIPPFGVSPQMPRAYAKAHYREMSERKHDPKRPIIAFLPDARPKNWSGESFTDSKSGVGFQTDSYAPDPALRTPKGGRYHHSVRQAQLFVSLLRTPEAVRRYCRDFDNRAAVLAYAQQVLAERMAAELKALGAAEMIDERMI